MGSRDDTRPREACPCGRWTNSESRLQSESPGRLTAIQIVLEHPFDLHRPKVALAA
ncbi:hypothetical protein D3C72_1070610 [compost metagenome]